MYYFVFLFEEKNLLSPANYFLNNYLSNSRHKQYIPCYILHTNLFSLMDTCQKIKKKLQQCMHIYTVVLTVVN